MECILNGSLKESGGSLNDSTADGPVAMGMRIKLGQ